MIREEFINCLVDIGINSLKEKTSKRIDNARLQSSLKDYLLSQKKIHDLCSIKEEFDFQGLMKYISRELLDDVQSRFFSMDSKERERARNNILNKSLAYANCKTEESKKLVTKMVCTCFDIIRNFFIKGIDEKDYILASDIVDSVNSNVNEKFNELNQKFENSLNFNMDHIFTLAQDNNFEAIELNVNKGIKAASIAHPLFPEYGYSFEKGRLKSKALTDSAIMKYPPRMKMKAKLLNDGFGKNPMDYAFRHQLGMTFSIDSAIKYLGDEKDPVQCEAESIIGKHVTIFPPEFPSAFACSISVGSKNYYDYVLLRTKEILDDGTYIITNEEQKDYNVHFIIKYKSNDIKVSSFSTTIKSSSSRENLHYRKFLKALVENANLIIHVLRNHKILFSGTINFSENNNLTLLDYEIDLFEQICLIENFFEITFDLPLRLEKSEFKKIVYLSKLIRNNNKTMLWKKDIFSLIKNEDTIQNFDFLSSNVKLKIDFYDKIEIFGISLNYHLIRYYNHAILKDFKRKKNEIYSMKVGATIKLSFIAGKDNTCYHNFLLAKNESEHMESNLMIENFDSSC